MTRFWDILQWTVVGAIAVAAFVYAPRIGQGLGTFGSQFWVPETLAIASAGQYRPPK